MSDYVLAISTIDNEAAAVELARELLERRLVACVNIVDRVRSLYRWQGNIEDEAEVLLLMKTRPDRFRALDEALAELHPYDTPELIAVPIDDGSASYLSWIDRTVALN